MNDAFDKFVTTPHVDQPAWINDYFAEIARSLERAHQVTITEPVHIEPVRKFDGLFVFADGVDFDPGRGRGVYYWDSVADNWISINVTSLIPLILQLFTAAGYGGVKQSVPVALPDITATPQIMPADEGVLAVPFQVIQDFANDGIRYAFRGHFAISANFSLLHNESNGSRSMQWQIYNATDDEVLSSTNIAVGRNQEGTNFSGTTLIEIQQVSVGALLVGRLVSVDETFTSVTVDGYGINSWSVGTAFNL